MVQVKNYNLRQKEGEEKSFITLTLESGIEMVQSQNTGRFYATTRTCNISTTFDEATAQRMIGQQIPGAIVRVPCEEYEYIIPESGEIITLGYSWDYVPDESTIKERILEVA